MIHRSVVPALVFLLLACGSAAAPAQNAPGAPDGLQAEQRAAGQAAANSLQKGPAQIDLAGQATIRLPEGFAYVPKAEGGRLMRSLGNQVGDDFLGLIFLRGNEGQAFYTLDFEKAGYIKDDDAKDWKADELLQQMRDGTEEGNKRRKQMGVPELEVTGWIEPPRYQAATHQLVWSVGARDKGAPAGDVEGVNYRTLVLGREGYVAMTLITDRAHIDALKPATANLLDQLTFVGGKGYADFNSSTDHVAEFGLAALVAGVAAKKLGLLAIVAAFVLKFAKVIFLAVAAAGWALRKKLGMGGKAPAPAPTVADSGLSAPGAAAPGSQAPSGKPGGDA